MVKGASGTVSKMWMLARNHAGIISALEVVLISPGPRTLGCVNTQWKWTILNALACRKQRYTEIAEAANPIVGTRRSGMVQWFNVTSSNPSSLIDYDSFLLHEGCRIGQLQRRCRSIKKGC